jgi:hypothetical protein
MDKVSRFLLKNRQGNRSDLFRSVLLVAFVLMFFLILAFNGCSDNDRYEAVCKNQQDIRVADNYCQGNSGHWVYFPQGRGFPGIGRPVRGGSTMPPSEGEVDRNAPSNGGVVSEDGEEGSGKSGSSGSGDEGGDSGSGSSSGSSGSGSSSSGSSGGE